MPEQHRKYSGNAENKRKSQEIPLPTQEIYVCIAKKFHCFEFPLTKSTDNAPLIPLHYREIWPLIFKLPNYQLTQLPNPVAVLGFPVTGFH